MIVLYNVKLCHSVKRKEKYPSKEKICLTFDSRDCHRYVTYRVRIN